MKKTIMILLALLPVMAAAQTVEGILGDLPKLPTPQEWAQNNGHTEEFLAKIDELEDKLLTVTTANAPAAAQPVDPMAMFAQMQSSGAMDPMAQMAQMQAQLAGAQAVMQQATDMMARLNLSEADLKKLADMSDAEAEAFVMQRMQQSGMTTAELAAFGNNMAAAMPQNDVPAMDNPLGFMEYLEAETKFAEQMQLFRQQMSAAENEANTRIAEVWAKQKPIIQEATAKLPGLDDVLLGVVTQAEHDSAHARVQAMHDDYSATAYGIWTEFIIEVQGKCRILLQYAHAADEAKAKAPNMMGGMSLGALQALTSNAVSVASQLIEITASEPDLPY